MRNVLFISSLVAAATVVACDSRVDPTWPQNILADGRFEDHVDPETGAYWLSFGYPGTSFRFAFQGESATIYMEHDSSAEANRVPHYNLILNGQVAEVIAWPVGKGSHQVVNPDPRQVLAVELFRRTESSAGVAHLNGIKLSENGTFADQGVPTAKRVEFIGNSITAGYGNEGTMPCRFSDTTSNAYVSYAFLVGRDLGVRVSSVAHSGRGLIRNYAGKEGLTMPQNFHRAYSSGDMPFWEPLNDLESTYPNVVHINLGTNDFSTGHTPDSAEFVGAYKDFVLDVHTTYKGKPNYIVAIGPMLGDERGDLLFGWLSAVEEELESTAPPGLAAPKVTLLRYETTPESHQGCDHHPGAESHRQMAAQLKPVLTALLGVDG